MITNKGSVIAGILAAIAATAIGGLVVFKFATATREDASWRKDFSHSLSRFADLGRLARCAWIVTDDVGASSDDAFSRLASNDQVEVDARLCSWHSVARECIENTITWRRTGASTVELCGMVRRNELEEPGETVDHDDYTFPEIEGTPVQEGARCYTLDVSKTPPDKWGVPFSMP